MIIDGRAIASSILAEVRSSIEHLPHPLVARAIVMQPSAATESYIRIKESRAREAGMDFELIRMEVDATTDDLLAKIALPGADGIIVQLPLPPSIDTHRVLNAIPLAQDADVLSDAAQARFREGSEGALLPPVVGAIAEILERENVPVAGKHAFVIGNGSLVGEPAAVWLRASGASVTVITKESGPDALGQLRDSQLIVSGAGSPGLITPALISPCVVLIDAGTSESGGAIVGDATPECAEKASVFTPVPGGVGPIAVACLFKNASLLALRRALHEPQKAV